MGIPPPNTDPEPGQRLLVTLRNRLRVEVGETFRGLRSTPTGNIHQRQIGSGWRSSGRRLCHALESYIRASPPVRRQAVCDFPVAILFEQGAYIEFPDVSRVVDLVLAVHQLLHIRRVDGRQFLAIHVGLRLKYFVSIARRAGKRAGKRQALPPLCSNSPSKIRPAR